MFTHPPPSASCSSSLSPPGSKSGHYLVCNEAPHLKIASQYHDLFDLTFHRPLNLHGWWVQGCVIIFFVLRQALFRRVTILVNYLALFNQTCALAIARICPAHIRTASCTILPLLSAASRCSQYAFEKLQSSLCLCILVSHLQPRKKSENVCDPVAKIVEQQQYYDHVVREEEEAP